MENFQEIVKNFLAEPIYWHWWIISIILLSLELLLPGVVFLWLAISAIITGGIAFFFSSLGWPALGTIFAVLGVVCVIVGRHYLKPKYDDNPDHPNLSRRGDSYIGKKFKLETDTQNGYGKIKIGDSLWRAYGQDIKKGDLVKVTKVDGTTLIVEKDE